MPTKQGSLPGPPTRHGHFHPFLILAVKMVELPQQHANIVYWL